jgi:dienelactone hydrolase
MARIVALVSAAALALFLVASLWMAQLDRAGPAHADVVLEGGVPASVYLPQSGAGGLAFLDPPPRGARPPAVVVMHGFAGDRLSMSGLSRRLAAAGYAVLAIDARGHGQNRNAFDRSWAVADYFVPDLRAAVDFLRAYPFVDGSRIALLGHSMGAGASLDYATRDSGIDAVVLISGGWRLEGPYRPANALFLYAAGDPDFLKGRARQLAARLVGLKALEPGRTYGRPQRHDAVRLHEVADADHRTIIWSEEAVRESLAWLDTAFGIERPVPAGPTPADPRAPLIVALAIAFLLVLPGLGLLVGRLVPHAGVWPAEGRALGLLALAAAFALTMPLLSTSVPGAILSIEVGDAVVSHFALAGIVLLVAMRLYRPALLEGLLERPLAALPGAAVGLIGLFVLMQPIAVALHRATLTPERTLVFAAATLGLLPLTLAFNLLLRCGATASATLTALAGRVLILLVLFAGVKAGVLDVVLLFMLPMLAAVSLLFEALASACYATSRNLLAIALLDAAWLAFVIAAIMPVRF